MTGTTALLDCDRWTCSKLKCPHTTGAGPGLANDGESVCRFKHDPAKENSDPKDRATLMAAIPCKWGSECWSHKGDGCPYKHD